MAEAQQDQNRSGTTQSSAASNSGTDAACVSVWATGGRLEVDVGNGQYVAVPNSSGKQPTREEIYQALVAAGYQQRAAELADKAYNDVYGTS
jgi:hypothetical protein